MRILALMLLILAAAYTGGWFYYARQLETIVATLPAEAARAGMTLDGTFSRVTNFPRAPRIDFRGALRSGDTTITLPLASVTGIPLPGLPMTLSLPQGLRFAGPEHDPDIWSADALSLTGPLPVRLPESLTAAEITRWRDEGGQIVITNFSLQKNSLTVDGSAQFAFDAALQPAGALTVTMRGYNEFLAYLRDKGHMEPRSTFLITAVLAQFSKHDEKNGAPYMDAVLTLDKNTLYLGPARLLSIPAVNWP